MHPGYFHKKINQSNKDLPNHPKKIERETGSKFFKRLSGHKDSIMSINIHPIISNLFLSGSSDGNIRLWLNNKRKSIYSFQPNSSKILDLSVDYRGKQFLSCSGDGTIGIWNFSNPKKRGKIYLSKSENFKTIKSFPGDFFFATGGKELIMWDQKNFRPIQRLMWGVSSISKIDFNRNEPNLLSSLCCDRSIIIYDLRIKNPIKKIFMEMVSNDISWNPGFLHDFIVANENSNIYTFDLRNIIKPKKIYKDHVMSVNCLEHSSTGDSILTGSSDTTARLFNLKVDKLVNVFYSERMKRILDIKFLLDQNFFLTGSDDNNLRIWKKNDSKKIKDIKSATITDYSSSYGSFLPKKLRSLELLKKNLLKKRKNKTSKVEKHFLPGFLKF